MKRRKLDDIEDAVMKEDDPEAGKEGSDVKRRKLDDGVVCPERDHASSQEDPLNSKRQKGETPMREVATSSRDAAL